MEIWLDSIDLKAITRAEAMGLLHGVTTNPSLLSGYDATATIQKILEVGQGPVAVQLNSTESSKMVEEAKNLYSSSKRIIIKVPVTKEGFKTLHALALLKIPTMATCVFSAEQALLAAKAGASYVALYLTRLDKSGGNSNLLLEKAAHLFAIYKIEAKLLAASINKKEQLEKCQILGLAAATLNEAVFNQLTEDNPLTLEAIRQFEKAYKALDASLIKSSKSVA